LSLRYKRFNLKPHHAAAQFAELHAHQVNGLAAGLVLVGIALVEDLLQGAAFGQQLHHLEFKQVNLAVEPDRHVQAPGIAAFFTNDVQAECSKVAVEHAGVIALVLRYFVIGKPLVGDAGVKGGDQGLDAGKVVDG
jgi:hypothetical protein